MIPYSKEIIKHFKNPRNVGKMRDYNGLGKVGNPLCGDIMDFYIKVVKDKNGKEVIQKATFLTLGCAVAIANTSVLTEMVKSKTLEQAMEITKKDLLDRLGEVPEQKIHCSFLAVDALGEAIFDYLSKNKKPIPEKLAVRHKQLEKEKQEIEQRYKNIPKD